MITESKKVQAVEALRKCAKQHEKDITPTFNIRVSDLCNDIAEYVEELQKENAELKAQINKMKCCGNCKKRNSCIKHNNFVYPEMTNPINYNCYNLDKWEL